MLLLPPSNIISHLAHDDKFANLSAFKNLLRDTYFTLLDTTYNIDMPYTWFLSSDYLCHGS